MPSNAQVYELIKMNRILRPSLGLRMEISEVGIAELAMSIESQGLLQPVLVRPVENEFEIVAGDRRYLAHKHLRREEIRCIVTEMSDKECALARAVENVGREDLTPIEEAASYSALMVDHGLRTVEIAQQMGKTEGRVKRRLDLLDMPSEMQKAVHEGKIGEESGSSLLVRTPGRSRA